jgi:hypothetical protein
VIAKIYLSLFSFCFALGQDKKSQPGHDAVKKTFASGAVRKLLGGLSVERADRLETHVCLGKS